ncbi:MAG: DUF4912 domain-containing protein [Pirellulales bacterium]|nr:DUF4912 domain-containing protein [Pirellulales bacterium]
MITAARLKTRTVKDLAAMAKKKRVPGWHAMRKDELIKALVKHAKNQAARGAKRGKATGPEAAARSPNGKSDTKRRRRDRPRKRSLSPHAERRLREIKSKMATSKDLAIKSVAQGNGCTKDRLVVMVRDPYWLHAYWELTRSSIDRARAAMGQHWHGARPVLRLNEVTRNGTTSTATRIVRDIDIHGGVNNWYVDVQDPPNSYQLEIGYLAACGKFYSVARSNLVSTPQASSGDSFDHNWSEVAKDFDRIYAMSGGYEERESNHELKEIFEERLRRPMGDPMATQFGLGATTGDKREELNVEIDTELIVHGVTDPGAHVTLRGEPIHLRPDGTFAVRFNLPDRRHVLPVVASSSDGVEQRTIVLAVDRNTKVMEPVIRDLGE